MEGKITLAHGSGGRQTSELIENVFKPHFWNPQFTSDDAAILDMGSGKIAVSTDGFVVSPYEFPGGDIGKLSICGTVNDLACMGAKPCYLTCSFIIEEGFCVDALKKIVCSMEKTAKEAEVKIVAGDTKVVGKGQVDGLYITTTGIGRCQENLALSGANACAGDVVIVTGDIGRHGSTILLERGDFGIDAEIKSDCAPLWSTVKSVLETSADVHVIRDATRGGVGTVLYEIAKESKVGICLDQSSIPVSDEVKGICGLLGLDPLYLANEGTMVMVVSEADAGQVIQTLRQCPYSQNAAVIGKINTQMPGKVTYVTEIGTEVLLPQPGGELLPRIC